MIEQKGIFIVLEGLDGSGKSTQAKNIINHILKINPDAEIIHTREPGGFNNKVGEEIREVILNNKMHDHTRALLYAASRYEHQLMIKDWLEQGFIVICDRYIYSSLAYQCNDESDISEVLNINRFEEIVKPNYIFHFDVSFDTYLKRRSIRLNERELDELEKKGDNFFKKNIKTYDLAYKEVQNYCELTNDIFGENIGSSNLIIIDANKSIEEVKLQVEKELNNIIKEEI